MIGSEEDFLDNPDDKNYGLDLKRFTNHKKVFPWRFIVKVIIGLALAGFVYYVSNELAQSQKEISQPTPETGIEISISED